MTSSIPTTSMKYPHLVRPALDTTKEPLLFILFHGYGSNAEDLFDLASLLPPHAMVASVQAPITLSLGQYAWFPLDWSQGAPVARPSDVVAARDVVRDVVVAMSAQYGVSSERVVLLGFSQGAILSLGVAFAFPELMRGVIALSGRFPEELRPTALNSSHEQLRIFMGHGVGDPVIPVAQARDAHAFIHDTVVPVTYREYDMMHGISREEILHVGEWLRESGIVE